MFRSLSIALLSAAFAVPAYATSVTGSFVLSGPASAVDLIITDSSFFSAAEPDVPADVHTGQSGSVFGDFRAIYKAEDLAAFVSTDGSDITGTLTFNFLVAKFFIQPDGSQFFVGDDFIGFSVDGKVVSADAGFDAFIGSDISFGASGDFAANVLQDLFLIALAQAQAGQPVSFGGFLASLNLDDPVIVTEDPQPIGAFTTFAAEQDATTLLELAPEFFFSLNGPGTTFFAAGDIVADDIAPAVPLPASAVLLIGGLGALRVLRNRAS